MNPKFECDKCHEVYDYTSSRYHIAYYPPITYGDMKFGTADFDLLGKYELCKGCSKLLERWLGK